MAFKQTHDSKNSRTRNDEENTDTLRKSLWYKRSCSTIFTEKNKFSIKSLRKLLPNALFEDFVKDFVSNSKSGRKKIISYVLLLDK